MNDPILPDLPDGYYLATEDEACPKVYERQDCRWYDEDGNGRADPRCMPWPGYALHSIPALLSAASERDALKVELDEALSTIFRLTRLCDEYAS